MTDSNLIPYRSAWLYPVDGSYEANYRGFHYSASTLDELKRKIDYAIKAEDDLRTLNMYSANPRNYNTEIPMFSVVSEDTDEEAENRWIVQIQLILEDVDDNMHDNSIREVVISAPDVNTATKFAHQYIRKMQKDPDVDENWIDAEVISIVKDNG